MNFNTFQSVINKITAADKKLNDIYNIGIDLYEITDTYNTIISMLFKAYYGEIGEDWIAWFLYEKFQDNKEPLKAFDENNNEIITDIHSLWECVEEIKNSDNFKEYEYIEKPPITDEQIKKLFEEFAKSK